jgi:hypothetical protein
VTTTFNEKCICGKRDVPLRLMKNFAKALDVKGPAFTYLSGKFPGLTFEKLKAGVFIGPQIRQLFFKMILGNFPHNYVNAGPFTSKAFTKFLLSSNLICSGGVV